MGMSRAKVGASALAGEFGFGGAMLPAFRFIVVMDGIIMAMFTEVTLPTLSVETEDVVEGGQNQYTHKLPVRVDVGTLTLKRGITSNMEFLTWYDHVLQGDIANAKKQVTVIFLNVAKVPTIVWNFRDAYPIKWSGPQLTSDSAAIGVEEIELVHHGFEFENF